MAPRTSSKTKSGSNNNSRSSGSASNGRGQTRSNGSNTGSRKRGQGGTRTQGLQKLFEHQLADLYYVEKQLVKQLPKMAEKAVNEELAEAFNAHASETEGQITRLDKVYELIGRAPKGKKCEAMDGILAEARELMEEFADDPALDAAMVCAAQKVEHYEITSYGSLCAFAEQLGLDEVCDELEAILDEEKATDQKLSRLAETTLNIEADEQEGEGEESEADTEEETDEPANDEAEADEEEAQED